MSEHMMGKKAPEDVQAALDEFQKALKAQKTGVGMADVTASVLSRLERAGMADKEEEEGPLSPEDAADLKLQLGLRRAAESLKAGGHKFQHREAFMLMTYRTEGNAFEMKIWNSRDGVTPFEIVVDGMRYRHSIIEMQGPFFDKVEGAVGQWETRTEMDMMAAFHRVLNRAVLMGKMSPETAKGIMNSPEHARSFNLGIGLRAYSTGFYTDEPLPSEARRAHAPT